MITGREFIKQLEDAGAVPKNTRRIIIDADDDRMVMVYIEAVGADRILALVHPDIVEASIKVLLRKDQDD